MIRFKLLFLYIRTLMQIYLVQCQRHGGYLDYGSYYVPYNPEGGSGPVQYVPAQGPRTVNSGQTYSATHHPPSEHSPNGQYQPNGAYQSNSYAPYGPHATYGPHQYNRPLPPTHPNFNAPVHYNYPTAPYGLEQAHALSSAYPNQPVIVINNGGNGDTGGNSNNGNRNENGRGGGLFGNGNFGDLATLFLATRHHGHGGGLGPELGPDIAGPPVPIAAPVSTSDFQGANAGFNNNIGNTAETGYSSKPSISITIILPSSGGSVTVKDKKKKRKDKKKKSKKKCKDNKEEEEKIVISDSEVDEDDDDEENRSDSDND